MTTVFESDESPMTETCSLCQGPGEFMGILGGDQCFRCRNCGIVFSHPDANPPELKAADFVRSWATEHPDSYDIGIDVAMRGLAFEDSSWHNDVSASFCRDLPNGNILRLWVANRDPELREDNTPRFAVYLYDKDMEIVNGIHGVALTCEAFSPVYDFITSYLGRN